MEGLRQRARAAFPGELLFAESSHKVRVVQLLKDSSQNTIFTESKVLCSKLTEEIRDSSPKRPLKHSTEQKPDLTLQLIALDSHVTPSGKKPLRHRENLIDLHREDFLDLFDACEIEPYFLYLISQNASGYHHFKHPPPDSKIGHVDSFYLCSPWMTAVWSHNASMGNTRVIIILPRTPVTNDQTANLITNIRPVTFQEITEILREQQNLVGQALFMQTVFSTEMVTCLYDVLRIENHNMSQLEDLTQQAQEIQASGRSPEIGEVDMSQLWQLASVSNIAGFIVSQLGIIARQNDAALELLSTLGKTYGIGQSDHTGAPKSGVPSKPDIAADDDLGQAIWLLHGQMATQKKDIQQLQERGSNQSSTILNLINQSMAITTQSDSNAMKTIAVMTMFFLPGTFFATLFAIPSLHWADDQVVSGRFWIYWGFTLPCMAVIILIYKYWRDIRTWLRDR